MSNKQTIAYKTIGCKLNFAETSTIVREFERDGFEVVDFNSTADVYVINTCTVTANADKDCRKSVRKAIRQNPHAYVAMVGCFTQLNTEAAQSIDGVSIVLGNAEKFNLFNHYQNHTSNEIDYHGNIENLNVFHSSYSAEERTRVFLKIQDGCDYECTYCTIPMARGKSRSDSVANTVSQAKEIAQKKAKEIVLTGVNTGDFGNGTDESFFDLIKELDNLEGIERIRISSIEPNLLTGEIIDFIAESKLFVPHFHIPLQSGSNKILADMHRRYRRELYSERVRKIKSVIPDCCIGVDAIVGFPTETEEQFLETFNFLKELDISYLHVFSYSERDNTKAIELDNVVSHQQKQERSKNLHRLSVEKRLAFYNKFVGKNRAVLFESHENGKIQGHTDNYINVVVEGSNDLVNKIKNVNLVKIENGAVLGKLL